MNPVKNERGMAMFVVIIILFLLVPIVYSLSKWTSLVLQGQTYEKTLKNARVLSTTLIADYMRQFSQDLYEDHYANYQLNKDEYDFGDYGFTKVTPTTNAARRTMFITNTAYYKGQDIHKTLQTLIRFQNDVARFSLILPGDTTPPNSTADFDIDPLRITGAIYTTGRIQVNSPSAPINGVLISSSIIASNGLIVTPAWRPSFTGQVYSTGPAAGFPKNDYVPAVDILPIDLSYYGAKNNYAASADEVWRFDSTGMFSVGAVPVPKFNITINGEATGTGAVLYAKGYNITIPASVINGRVTVVCAKNGASGGHVTITGDITYLNGGTSDGFAVLAEDGISFGPTATGSLTVQGLYYMPPIYNAGRLTTQGNGSFNLKGTLMVPIGNFNEMFANGPSAFPGGRTFTYDPNLMRCFPPGIPEKPHLVMWRLQG